jgi:hypothetical protein
LSIDRAKAQADYALLEGNAFWQYFWETIEQRQKDELKLLATTSETSDIYRSQGRVETWGLLARLTQDLVKNLGR